MSCSIVDEQLLMTDAGGDASRLEEDAGHEVVEVVGVVGDDVVLLGFEELILPVRQVGDEIRSTMVCRGIELRPLTMLHNDC